MEEIVRSMERRTSRKCQKTKRSSADGKWTYKQCGGTDTIRKQNVNQANGQLWLLSQCLQWKTLSIETRTTWSPKHTRRKHQVAQTGIPQWSAGNVYRKQYCTEENRQNDTRKAKDCLKPAFFRIYAGISNLSYFLGNVHNCDNARRAMMWH